jgi:DNA mismatch endonuclease Vsr
MSAVDHARVYSGRDMAVAPDATPSALCRAADRASGVVPRDVVGKPVPLNQTVTQQMSRMPRSSTGPELALRQELHRRGLRFRINYSLLPGRPDLAFTRVRLAIFVDGCFWHLCPEHGTIPKTTTNGGRRSWRATLCGTVRRTQLSGSWASQRYTCGSMRIR